MQLRKIITIAAISDSKYRYRVTDEHANTVRCIDANKLARAIVLLVIRSSGHVFALSLDFDPAIPLDVVAAVRHEVEESLTPVVI